MKHPIFILLAILPVSILLLFSSCRKEDKPPIYLAGDTTYGFATMKKNGYEMMASSTIKHCTNEDAEKMAIYFLTYDETGVLSEYFILYCLPLNNLHYKLCESTNINCDNKAAYYTVIDDQLEDRYLLRELMDNYLEITDIDEESGWIKGKFQFFMEIDHGRPKGNPANPDRVAFTDGYFEVKLVE